MGLRIRKDKVFDLPPGLIGVASSTMGRYREFDITLHSVKKPPASFVRYELSLDIAYNFSNMCRKVLENKDYHWLWILGDDHILEKDILLRLLGRNVDIVAPLCLQRVDPFLPVIYEFRKEVDKSNIPPNCYWQVNHDWLRDKKGLVEVDACGNAGMLIRRNVIEKIAEDWFRTGWQSSERSGSDLYFCKKAMEAGFKIHVDMDNPIGHIAHMGIWPMRKPDGECSVAIRTASDIPDINTDKTWYY